MDLLGLYIKGLWLFAMAVALIVVSGFAMPASKYETVSPSVRENPSSFRATTIVYGGGYRSSGSYRYGK